MEYHVERDRVLPRKHSRVERSHSIPFCRHTGDRSHRTLFSGKNEAAPQVTTYKTHRWNSGFVQIACRLAHIRSSKEASQHEHTHSFVTGHESLIGASLFPSDRLIYQIRTIFLYVSLPIETSVFSASNTPAHSLIATNRKTSAIHDFALDIFPISKYYWHTQHIFLVKTTHAHPFHAVVYSAGAFYQNTFDTIILMPRNRNHSSCMLALKSDVVE